MKKIIIGCAVALALQACAWVKLTPAGEQMRVLAATEVKNCKKLGNTTVSLATKIAIIPLNQKKIEEELKLLARNSAADFNGADSIVPTDAPENGKQTFEVYDCIN